MTDDEMLPVFAEFLFTLKFISLSFHGKSFWVLHVFPEIVHLQPLEK